MNDDDLFLEGRFRNQVDAALVTVKRLLDTSRCPRYAAEAEDHSYEDKYELAEWLTVMAMSSVCNALERVGVSQEKLSALFRLYEKSSNTITLRFSSVESCEFDKEKMVSVDSAQEDSLEVSVGSAAFSFRRKTRHQVKEYHWKVGLEYSISAFLGNDPTEHPLELYQASREATLLTRGHKQAPLPAKNARPDMDVDITWLIRHLGSTDVMGNRSSFSIDRSSEKCRTPRRNEDIDTAIQSFFAPLSRWCEQILQYFTDGVERNIGGRNMESLDKTPPNSTYSLEGITTESLFVPVLPLLENQGAQDVATADLLEMDAPSSSSEATIVVNATSSSAFLLPQADAKKFLREQCRALDNALRTHMDTFPASRPPSSSPSSKQEKAKKGDTTSSSHLITVDEANLVLILLHVTELSQQYQDSLAYIEDMLRTQLLKAIGKEIGPRDFEDYVRFHNQKWFVPGFAPEPFSYAIRRPNHYPEGVISIEEVPVEAVTTSSDRPITTFRRNVSAELPSMKIPINAATSIALEGQAYLHGWMLQTFRHANEMEKRFRLVARARQFSCFLLMVGSVSAPNVFDPKDAIILQNKDEVLVPLLLEQLPSAKEFRDAISSLSPEQQRFAKAFRTMQLESSVFGICVVQLKPQLETLLRLPSDALTKEIRLTQDLLSLFIDYQIPSDLLSFDDNAEVPLASKVEAVRGHVAAVMAMVDKAKEDQLQEAEREADIRHEVQHLATVHHSLVEEFDKYKVEKCGMDRIGVDLRNSDHDSISCETPVSVSSLSLRRSHKSADITRGIRKMMNQNRAKSARFAPVVAATLSPSAQASCTAVSSFSCSSASLNITSSTSPTSAPPTESTEVEQPLSETKEAKKNEKPTSNYKHETAMQKGLPKDTTADGDTIDLTQVPKKLDAVLGDCKDASAVRSTIIKTADLWKKRSPRNLVLSQDWKEETLSRSNESLKTERNKAFDLLDALSKSGSLPLRDCELHVMIAATHSFGNGLVETVVQDNINPIEKMEQSTLLLASTIHSESPAEGLVLRM